MTEPQAFGIILVDWDGSNCPYRKDGMCNLPGRCKSRPECKGASDEMCDLAWSYRIPDGCDGPVGIILVKQNGSNCPYRDGCGICYHPAADCVVCCPGGVFCDCALSVATMPKQRGTA
jgi:hypothetical protein